MATATSAEPLATHSPPPGGRMGRHLNLTRELALTQFKLKYTGSVLGYLWSLLKPMMVFAIMYAVFDRLLHAGRTSDRFTLQLLIGIVIWTFFSETTVTAVNAIVVNGNLINKASFPRAILVIASSLTALMTFAINLSLIVVIAGAARQLSLGWHSLLAVPLLIELYALVIGISLILSALFVFYRDLGHIWEIFTQLLFYGSAVVFPLSRDILHSKVELVALNPVAQIIEDLRHALVTQDPRVPWTATILGRATPVPLLIVVAVLVIGVVLFRRLAPHFSESL
ncbi:MAG: polysaccharide permease [Chloroflexi bacterium]|jgi:ABC-2 type transport system permease protein|nr:polysaccharide permease [Chloroflexota bacterium]MEA2616447.1 type transport system permease protein [Chloroflexota bacterium]